jgi:tRNA threonylcarbamoyl adenosine modification protein (Sua5/YciO/YrdC/YwlC family)
MDNLLLTPVTVISALNGGKVGVMPTDTVYGVVARAADEAAVTKLYALKRREQKPGTIIAASAAQLFQLGVPAEQLQKVEKWWPGPLSAVLVMQGNDYLHQGVGDIAMRVVADPGIRKILEQTGPLLTSSANQPGEPGATTIDEAWQYFGDAVDFYVDGGTITSRVPSTIVKPSTDGIIVLRQGAIKI